MEVEILSRIQFAFTIAFHYIYPPLTIGLGVILVIMEGLWLKTGSPRYHNMSKFWTKIFALIFAIGVATGIVMEFEFGTNWATYSRFVGDVFGSALAAEGVFAFFLESGFLAVLLFGWDKVGPKMHFFSTCMVCLGSHFSAIWIVVANSWMQTPSGYHIEINGETFPPDYLMNAADITSARAVIDDFWTMIFNPSSMDRLIHVILGCWLAGSFVVLSISAYYILKGRFSKFATTSMKVGLAMATITALFQLVSADSSARGVAKNQPVKLAAMEGLFETQTNAPLSIIGWVDMKTQTTHSIEMPGMLSFLIGHNVDTSVQGLNDFPKSDWPKVPAVFQTYRVMIAMGLAIIGLSLLGCYLWYRGKLFDINNTFTRWYLKIMVIAVLFPQIANQAGWFTAELGRQPWVVYNVLRTSEGLSKAVQANQVLWSLIMFGLIYALLFVMFIYLLNKKIQQGPKEGEDSDVLPSNWRKHARI